MFGHYYRTLDEKNRIIVPAKFRKELGNVFYITLGPDQVLELREQKAFLAWEEKLLKINMLNKHARQLSRVLLSNTLECQVDLQGRVVIPEHFLNRAQITKEIVFAGVGNKIELWPKAAFEAMQNQFSNEGSLDQLAAKLHKEGAEL